MGSVKSYEKISEGKTDNGYFEVKIKAVLSRSSINRDFAAFHILIESMNKPRIMVIIKLKQHWSLPLSRTIQRPKPPFSNF